MARPHGRDRLEERPDGSRLLSCPFPKGWVPRGDPVGSAAPHAGTAVDWDGEFFEVVAVEEGSGPGLRYELAPWPEGQVFRAAPQPYDEATEAARRGKPRGAPPAVDRHAPVAARHGATVARGDTVHVLGRELPRSVFALALGILPWLLLPLSGTSCSFLALPSMVLSNGITYLVHELGHTAVFIFFGSAAVPAVVMTVAYEQSRWNVLGVVLVLATLTGVFVARSRSDTDPAEKRRWRRRALLVGVVLALYPFVALSEAHKLVAILGGHLSEAVVAAVFFRRAILGGLFDDRERPVWAALAWCLALANVRLFLGLLTSASDRTDYLSVSWTGGDNDLVVAGKLLDTSLESVAAFMLAASIALPLAAAVLAFRRAGRG